MSPPILFNLNRAHVSFPPCSPQFVCSGTTATPLSLINNTNFYSTPGSGPTATTQTGTAVCPYQRSCVNGTLLPAVVFTGACASGSVSTTIFAANASQPFGPVISVINPANPVYNGAMQWAISSVTPNDAGCPITSTYFSIVPASTYSSTLSLGELLECSL